MKSILKNLWIFGIVVLSYGCGFEPSTIDATNRYSIPKELDGIKIYQLHNPNSGSLYIAVMPKESNLKVIGTRTCEKHPKSTIIIDDEKYSLEKINE